MDIKCRKTSCSHNNSYTCTAKKIQIGANTECNSFDYSPSKLHDFSKNMFEADTEHYANSRHFSDVKLNCNKASCLFNHDNSCSANGITVLDDNEQSTQCGTFCSDAAAPRKPDRLR